MNVVGQRKEEITITIDYLSLQEDDGIWYKDPDEDSYFFTCPNYEMASRITLSWEDDSPLPAYYVTVTTYYNSPNNKKTKLRVSEEEYKLVRSFLDYLCPKPKEKIIPIQPRSMYNAIFELQIKE